MPLFSDKNCGCTCRNPTEWGPIGPGLPEATCPACSGAAAYDVGTGSGSPPYDGGAPCDFLAFFDCPFSYTYDGLAFWNTGPAWANGRGAPLVLLKNKLVEEECVWTARKQVADQGLGSGTGTGFGTGSGGASGAFPGNWPSPGDGNSWVDGLGCNINTLVSTILARATSKGWYGECKHGWNWAQGMPGATYDGYEIGGVPDQDLVEYKTPRFGCWPSFAPGSPYTGGPTNADNTSELWLAGQLAAAEYNITGGSCSWYDLLGMVICTYCDGGAFPATPSYAGNFAQYVEILERYTRITWSLDIEAGTLTGTTDSAEDAVYSIGSFVCGDRNTLTLTSGQSWAPKRVCIVPGGTAFRTPCELTTKENVVPCCDPGVRETKYWFSFPGCNIPLLEMCSTRYKTFDDLPDLTWGAVKALQGSISSNCGIFAGTSTYNCSTNYPDMVCNGVPVSSSSVNPPSQTQLTFYVLTWCESGTWYSSTFCQGTVPIGSGLVGTITREICKNVATTLTQCHPIWGHAWSCSIPATTNITGTGTGSGGGQACQTRFPCCCIGENVETPCCADNPLPPGIFADITVAGCDPVTASLSYTGSATFVGTTTIGSCSGATITATMTDEGGGVCGWTVAIEHGGVVCFTASGVAANPCLVIPVSRSGTWACGCCTMGGSVTVDLYR